MCVREREREIFCAGFTWVNDFDLASIMELKELCWDLKKFVFTIIR